MILGKNFLRNYFLSSPYASGDDFDPKSEDVKKVMYSPRKQG